MQAHLEGGGNLEDTESQELAWIAHQVLAAAGERGITPWLTLAHDELQSIAASLDDPQMRRRYLDDHPMRRGIAQAWAAASAATPPNPGPPAASSGSVSL